MSRSGRDTTGSGWAERGRVEYVLAGFFAKRQYLGEGPGGGTAADSQARGHVRMHKDDLSLSRPRQRNAESVRVLEMLCGPDAVNLLANPTTVCS